MSKTKELYGKYSKAFFMAVILVVVLYFIARNVGAFGNILLVLLGFGAVVMVHEFGHFVAAKLGGIKVEAFSIFMPPILLGVKRTENGLRFRVLPEIFPNEDEESDEGALNFAVGRKGSPSETEYRIGLIPFGGFVKMLGQEDTGSAKDSDDPRSFANKPTHTRAAVLAAGVTFNVISAVIIFMIAFLIGIKLPPALVGDVIPDSPAARAGLKPGDEIIEIEGKDDDLDFTNIALAAALSGRDEKIPMRVRHADGSEEDLELVAEQLPGESMRGFGILAPGALTVAKLSKDGDEYTEYLHLKTGLLPGDNVESVDGKHVAAGWEFRKAVQHTLAPEVTLSVERTADDGRIEVVETQVRLNVRATNSYDVESEGQLSHICSMVPRLQVTSVSTEQDTSGGETGPGLQSGDIVLAAGDVENPTYKQMRDITTEHEDKELSVKVLRRDDAGGEKIRTVTVLPRRRSNDGRVIIGIGLGLDFEHAVVARTITAVGGPAKLEIPQGAAITAVDGAPVSSFYDVVREIRRYPGERITIDWRLDAETAGNIALEVGTNEGFISVKSDFAEIIPLETLEKIYKAGGPVDAVVMGYRKTLMFIAQTYVTLKRLVGGLVSPKNLMGPVGIISMSYKIVAQRPFVYYVYFLGLISAVIAVFNFLPLPPLDGGLVVLLFVEKVKGSAFSEHIQTVIAYTGWILILALFLYVTFNDILRTFFGYGL
ncbi:MAG: site-2 protease family protein [Planctomycetota bacterium]|jgi:regulator of sigma E protease